MFQDIAGFVVGLTSSFFVSITPVSQVTAVDNAGNLASLFGPRAVEAARVTALTSGIILQTAKSTLQKNNSNSLSAIIEESDLENANVKPDVLVNYIALQTVGAYAVGACFSYFFTQSLQSNRALALTSVLCTLRTPSDGIRLFVGMGIIKIALEAIKSLPNPIGTFTMGLFFIPSQIINLLFGSPEPKNSEYIETVVPKFKLQSIWEIIKINQPGIATGGGSVMNGLVEGIGFGAMASASASNESDNRLIGKTALQAIIPSIDSNLIILIVLSIFVSIPLLKKTTEIVINWSIVHPQILNSLGLFLNLLIFFLSTPPVLGLGFIFTGLLVAKFMPVGMKKIMFFGGMI